MVLFAIGTYLGLLLGSMLAAAGHADQHTEELRLRRQTRQLQTRIAELEYRLKEHTP